MNETPRSERFHIGLFGKRNSGKSSLINALTGQEVAVVSPISGTTTDPVYKAMELPGIGPCVFIDTAGFDDEGALGELRVKKTMQVIERTDIAIMVCTDESIDEELFWSERLKEKQIPVIWIINKSDSLHQGEMLLRCLEKKCGQVPLLVSASTRKGMEDIRRAISNKLPDETMSQGIVGKLVHENDTVMLVMPQDKQAPKGRLILPQVQTIRELLDRKCLVLSCTTEQIEPMLQVLKSPPKLIITDSQVFHAAYEKKPEGSKLTSFSVLFAQYKGDIDYYIEGANSISNLTEDSRVLIAEACTHAPLTEDIGRVKIPAMLRKRIGTGLTIDFVSGTDFPEDLHAYQLIIHCGACMFNRKYVLNRISTARSQSIPMTNYGVAIAYLTGILDKIDY